MIKIVKTRIAQRRRTVKYPKQAPVLPDRFKGLPKIAALECPRECSACIKACPVKAIQRLQGAIALDLGTCIFCGACARQCPEKAIEFTVDHSLAVCAKGDLLLSGTGSFRQAQPLEPERLRLFRKSLRLRQVSAGGCNACEADVNVLNTIVFDLARFGIQFVASPRHADGLLVTGPVTKNMELALRKTYDATPEPKIVIAVGTCAVSGGMFAVHREVHRGVDEILPVDLYVPGCPPHPYTILDGLLRLLGRSTSPQIKK
jgi:Ni,Fe-hydrogenase III small subunit/formate hydrogenlyase subunit 6/NADH:ubiquinone oxidoreductase subunit I